MKKLSKLSLLVIINLFSIHKNNAQIFALAEVSNNVYSFSKIEIATGNITLYQSIGTLPLLNYASSCINNQSMLYYLSTPTQLITINAITGQIISNVVLPIPQQTKFQKIAFNPCDQCIYGMVIDNNNNFSFCRYNPATGVMTTLSSLGTIVSAMGGNQFIDPSSGIYYFEDQDITGIDINTGQVLFSNWIMNLPNENFGHVAFKCSTGEIFGTSATTSPVGTKYFSTLDPSTGTVTHISSTGWNVGIWKPMGGGARIDQLTGIYYYSAMGASIVGANTNNGAMVYNQLINTSVLFFLEHFSECECETTGINPETISATIKIIPNPFEDRLKISTDIGQPAEIIIYNSLSQKILQKEFSNEIELNTEVLSKGLYVYEIRNKNGVIKNGKLIKE